jgi:hypothetical protein
MNRCCVHCGSTIPSERIEVLPETVSCVSCSTRNPPKMVARMIYSHKTAGDVVIAKGSENVRRLEREYARAR